MRHAALLQDGRVSIFRYPCLDKDSACVSSCAHSGPVASVRFSCDGRFLLSVGLKDRALLSWRVWRAQESLTGPALVHATRLTLPPPPTTTRGPVSTDAAPPPGGDSGSVGEASLGTGAATAAHGANGLIGTPVVLHGLVEQHELNGREGIAVALSSDANPRFAVSLDGGKRTVRVTPGHVRRAPLMPKPKEKASAW